jgi:hypothetical protein
VVVVVFGGGGGGGGSDVVVGVVCVVVVDVVVWVDVVDVDKVSKNTAALMCVAELVEVTQAPAGAVPSAHLYIPSLMPWHTSETGMSAPSSW